MAKNKYAILDRMSGVHGCGCHGEDDDAEIVQLEYDREQWHAKRKAAQEKRVKKAADEATAKDRKETEEPADTTEVIPPVKKAARKRARSAPKKGAGTPPEGPGGPELALGGASAPSEPEEPRERPGVDYGGWDPKDVAWDPEDDDR